MRRYIKEFKKSVNLLKIRDIKGRNSQDSSDTNNFYLGGSSAGAIIAIHMAFAHDDSLKVVSNGTGGEGVVKPIPDFHL